MFYAIPEMHTRDGQIVNAIFGVVKFMKSLVEMSPDDRIIIASESGSNFREALFAEYKWTRDRMPDNLRSQIGPIFDFFNLSGIPVLVREWYEADDIIGSVCEQWKNKDMIWKISQHFSECEFVIVSSDKDLCQFVQDGKVRIFDAMKQKNLRKSDVIEKFGVPPEQVVDYLSIVWDSSDNIPGIAGFGPKKAVDLLKKYDTLQGIYDNMSELTEKMQEILKDQRENAFLSQKLASIVIDLDLSVEDMQWWEISHIFHSIAVIDFLKKYEFKSLIPAEYREVKKDLEKTKSQEITTIEELDSLLLKCKKTGKVYLATEKEWSIALGVDDEIYRVDPHIVDVSGFLSLLFENTDIELIGYDLKEDLKRILVYKNPLQGWEGQGRLF